MTKLGPILVLLQRMLRGSRSCATKLVLTVVAASFAVASTPGTPALADPASNEVQQWLEEVSASGVPAIAVVVTRGDSVELATGAGTVDGNPVNEHTQFRIESLSKSFTSAAVLQLVERGSIDMDAPVVQYLSAFRMDDGRADSITVRQLLNQSSGISDMSLGFDQYKAGPQSPSDAGALLAESRLAFDPGTGWAYSNANYWMLAWLVEEVSGMDFEAYIQQEILEPLGMYETSIAPTADQVPGVSGHAPVFGEVIQVKGPDALVTGAGGMASTAHDMGIWLRFQHGVLPDSDAVLSQRSKDEMHRRQAPDNGLYALGWYSGPPADGGVQRVSHSGVGAGTSAYQGLFPDGVGIAVLQSRSTPEAYEVASHLYQGWSTGELGHPPVAPGPVRDIVVTGVVLAVLGLCGLGIARSRRWASRAGRVRMAAALATGTLVTVAITMIPWLGSLLMGRSATWPVLYAVAPVPVLALWVTAGGIGLLTATRAMRIYMKRRSS